MTKTFKEEAEKLINTLVTRETHKGSYQRVRIRALEALQHLHDAEVEKIYRDNAILNNHIEKLRHAVDVAHWSSRCGNCRYEKLIGTETSCPQCKFRFDYVTTQYMNEEKLAKEVFPHLEYLQYVPLASLQPARKDSDE